MLLALILLTACDGGDDSATGATSPCEGETRSEPLTIGSAFSGSSTTLTVESAEPLPPAFGENHWVLALDQGELPLEGCVLSAEPSMPDHGHGGPAPTITEQGGGLYDLSVQFTMSGYWELETQLSCADAGVDDTIVITVCAE